MSMTTAEIRKELQSIQKEGFGMSNYQKQLNRLMQVLFDMTKLIDGKESKP